MFDSASLTSFTLHYLAPVGAVMLLGLLGGKAARFFHLPKVTGYLLTGLLIGPSVSGLISHEIVSNLSLLNDIALGLIMFAIGGVFEIHHIKLIRRRAFWLTVGQSVGVLVITTSSLYFFGMEFAPAVLLGTIAIATAPAAPIMVIREYEAKGEFTDTLITIVATSNIVCILAFQLTFSMVELAHGDHSSAGRDRESDL